MSQWKPIAIRQIDLADGLNDLMELGDYRRAAVLFRYHDKPIAYRTMNVVAGRISAADLWIAAMHSAPDTLQREALRDLIQQPASESLPQALPRASIIVCTRDRPDDLDRCLESATPMLNADVEMLVIDNRPSDDRSQEVAAKYPVRYFREQRKGLNWARARGVREAKHEIILFTDDDVVLDAGWADALRREFLNPQIGGATGLVLPFEFEHEAQEKFEHYCGFSRGMNRKVFKADIVPPIAAGSIGAGASMGVRRDLALELKMFEIELDAGTATKSGGDSYAFYRLLRAGYDAVYEPRALAWHRHRRTMSEVDDTLYGYSVGVYCFWFSCLFRHRDWTVLRAAPSWFFHHHLKLVMRFLRGDRSRPWKLIAAEVRGVLDAPAAYWKSRRVEREYVPQ